MRAREIERDSERERQRETKTERDRRKRERQREHNIPPLEANPDKGFDIFQKLSKKKNRKDKGATPDWIQQIQSVLTVHRESQSLHSHAKITTNWTTCQNKNFRELSTHHLISSSSWTCQNRPGT